MTTTLLTGSLIYVSLQSMFLNISMFLNMWDALWFKLLLKFPIDIPNVKCARHTGYAGWLLMNSVQLKLRRKWTVRILLAKCRLQPSAVLQLTLWVGSACLYILNPSKQRISFWHPKASNAVVRVPSRLERPTAFCLNPTAVQWPTSPHSFSRWAVSHKGYTYKMKESWDMLHKCDRFSPKPINQLPMLDGLRWVGLRWINLPPAVTIEM